MIRTTALGDAFRTLGEVADKVVNIYASVFKAVRTAFETIRVKVSELTPEQRKEYRRLMNISKQTKNKRIKKKNEKRAYEYMMKCLEE